MEFLVKKFGQGKLKYFFMFQPEDMLDLCLNFNKFQSIYAYKCHAYKTRV